MPVAGKKYVAVRVWLRVDPDTGDSTQYAIGDPYSGRVDDCQVAPEGPDGQT